MIAQALFVLSIVATLRVGMPFWTLCVRSGACGAPRIYDAERHELHANAEHWHDSQREPRAQRRQSERKRQCDVRFLALGQALFELHRIVNQHVLPGKGFGGDQA